ncbi:MAG: hypothetical protein ACYCX6_13280 [Vulcanimicrobiaceae bacterium]
MKSRKIIPLVALAVIAAGIAALELYSWSQRNLSDPPAASVAAGPTALPSVPPSAPPTSAPPASAPPASAPPTSVPTAAPAAATPATPVATASPASQPAVPMVAPQAPPKITGISLSTSVAHPGQIVSGTVTTSSNVASVVARIAGYAHPLAKVGVGRFVLTYQVPNLPPFLRRTYTIEVIARNTAGAAATGGIPITIR